MVAVARAMGSDLGWLLTGVRASDDEPSDSILRRAKALYTVDQLDRLFAAGAAIFSGRGGSSASKKKAAKKVPAARPAKGEASFFGSNQTVILIGIGVAAAMVLAIMASRRN